jgi:hypothetical protein
MVAFASGAIAQEKKDETQAPAAEKTKLEKPKASKPMTVYGTVAAYEAGKTIRVKGKKEQEWMFDITPGAKIKGEVKKGDKVRVVYKKEDNKVLAMSIAVATARKAKVEKKERETK